MIKHLYSKNEFIKTLSLCLAIIMIFTSMFISLGAVQPIPSPTNPFMYDDFSNGGSHTGPWQPWYSSSGSGTWAKAVVDGRHVGRFTQSPTNSTSVTEFSAQNAKTGKKEYTNSFYGYKYLTVTMRNPGYADCRIKIDLIDNNGVTAAVSGGYISVPTD